MLRVSLLGNLGAAPELRYSQKGSAIASFRVAVNQVKTSAEGERQETTEWFRIKASGRLEISHYQSREGEPRTGFDVWADDVVTVSGRGGADDGQAAMGGVQPEREPALVGAAPRPRARSIAENREPLGVAGELDDLPF
jgi:single-strand DNA-binding protein